MKNPPSTKFWFSAYYFVYFAGVASLTPFLALYYKGRGLSGSEIGILSAISPLVGLVAAPLWAGLADATRKHKAIFTFATLGVVIVAFVISITTTLFWLIPVTIAFAFISAPIMPLIDSNTMIFLGGKRDQYGQIRLWGAVGWAVAAPITGMLIQQSGIQWSFYAYAIMLAIALLIAIPIPMNHTQAAVPFWNGLRSLLSNRRWVFFLVMVFLIGISAASVSTYLYLYMKNLGAGETEIGLALSISTIGEIIMYVLAERILRRFKWRGLIMIALPLYIVRLVLYSFTDSPTLILVIQLIHGFTIPAIWAAGISYVAEAAPPGLGTTAQGIFTGVLNGLGSATGAFLGGVLYQNFGPVVMFRTFAVILSITLLLFWLVEKRIPAEATTP
jgi:PPP family 3-phenylpropionic acid transporter